MDFKDDCPCTERCPMNLMFNIIGGKWKIKIICTLNLNDSLRYGEIKRRIAGINATMLANSLRELETYGIVSRTQYDTMPVRVEYALTEVGKSLVPILTQLRDWSAEYEKQLPQELLS